MGKIPVRDALFPEVQRAKVQPRAHQKPATGPPLTEKWGPYGGPVFGLAKNKWTRFRGHQADPLLAFWLAVGCF